MDRIAIISDIHGNLPALEAVLGDIKERGISRIICLGDIAGKGPSSEAAVDIIKESCEIVVKGNWDYLISEVYDSDFLLWHRSKLRSSQIEFMAKLPTYTEFYFSGRLVRLCHAAAENMFHRIYSNDSQEDKLKLFAPPSGKTLETDVFGYGDIHSAYVQNFRGKTIFNVGSVGNPLELTQASYGIIEGKYGSKEISGSSIMLVRVPYDVEESIRQAEASGMPEIDEYADELRTARYRGANKK